MTINTKGQDTMKNHKHYEAARRAHYHTSFSPDKRAESACRSFDADIKALNDKGIEQRYIEKYERLWLEWMGAKSRCMSSMITGPANFPVARNEKANNAERNKGNACLDYYNKIVKHAETEAYYAANPHKRPVMSNDADAVEKLQSKLDACIKAQETMKAANKIIRKKPLDEPALIALLGEKAAKQIQEPDYAGRTGFPSYSLTNNNAEIKRLQGRIKVLNQRKEQGNQEIEINGVKIVQNADDMRLQIFFDGKPEREIIQLMKKNAFRWAPSVGAWQRQLTNNALYTFKHYVKPQLEELTA